MKKTKFWGYLLLGFFFLGLGIFFLILAVTGKVSGNVLTTYYSFVFMFSILGVLSILTAGKHIETGHPRDYLLDRMEYKKHIESRNEGSKYVRLLLSEADNKNGFHPSARFHSIPKSRLLDEDGNELEEVPKTFFVRQRGKAYHLLRTRTNKA